jgi:chaperonin GroEL
MIGINGLVVVEVSQECEFEVEYIEGMRIDGGVVSPGFITNPKTMEASLKNPNILIYKNKISAAADLVPLLEKLVQTRRHDLLVIAEDVEGEALAALLDYKARGLLNGLAIQAPASGSVRKAILEDIAVLTGGSLINSGLRGIDVSLLGGAEKVIVTKDYATVVGGRGKTQAIRGHIQEIQDEVDRATMNREEKKILLGRLAALAGGKVIIRVGSAEKKLRVEKALSACHVAVEAGIVPGGGIALFEAIPTLENLETENEAEALGVAIVRQALTAPLRTIVANAGEDHEAIIAAISDMQQRKRSLLDALRGPAQPKHFGYDVLTNKFVNMASAGIVDPAKVVCTALENAASTAMTILTSTST